ncbi:hypothetical protein AK88_05684, partial [Plasmodium fragile]
NGAAVDKDTKDKEQTPTTGTHPGAEGGGPVVPQPTPSTATAIGTAEEVKPSVEPTSPSSGTTASEATTKVQQPDTPVAPPPVPKPPDDVETTSSGGEGQAVAHGTTPGSGGGSSGPGSNGHQTPGSSGPGSTGTSTTGGSLSSGGSTNGEIQPSLPPTSKSFDPKDLIPYTPAIIPAVVGIGVIAFFLWK